MILIKKSHFHKYPFAKGESLTEVQGSMEKHFEKVHTIELPDKCYIFILYNEDGSCYTLFGCSDQDTTLPKVDLTSVQTLKDRCDMDYFEATKEEYNPLWDVHYEYEDWTDQEGRSRYRYK